MDHSLLIWINQGMAHPFFDAFFIWVSSRPYFAFPLVMALLACFCLRLGIKTGVKTWLLFALTIIVGDALGNLLKQLFAVARPCVETFDLIRTPGNPGAYSDHGCGNVFTGMPSNHALNFFAGAAFLLTTPLFRRLGLVLLVVAILVAFSRVYLAKHFPSQVVVGAVLGYSWGFMVAKTWLKMNLLPHKPSC